MKAAFSGRNMITVFFGLILIAVMSSSAMANISYRGMTGTFFFPNAGTIGKNNLGASYAIRYMNVTAKQKYKNYLGINSDLPIGSARAIELPITVVYGIMDKVEAYLTMSNDLAVGPPQENSDNVATRSLLGVKYNLKRLDEFSPSGSEMALTGGLIFASEPQKEELNDELPPQGWETGISLGWIYSQIVQPANYDMNLYLGYQNHQVFGTGFVFSLGFKYPSNGGFSFITGMEVEAHTLIVDMGFNIVLSQTMEVSAGMAVKWVANDIILTPVMGISMMF